MGRVFIQGLSVDTMIGVYPWERKIRQCLHIDLQAAWDIRAAAATDTLAKTLDYARLAEDVTEFAKNADFALVETFAERLAVRLIEQFNLTWLHIKVTKPGAIAGVKAAGVEIERGSVAENIFRGRQ